MSLFPENYTGTRKTNKQKRLFKNKKKETNMRNKNIFYRRTFAIYLMTGHTNFDPHFSNHWQKNSIHLVRRPVLQKIILS